MTFAEATNMKHETSFSDMIRDILYNLRTRALLTLFF